MDEKKKAPKLRFKGFTDDWKQRKIGELLLVNSGKDYKKLNKGNIPVYGTGGYMLSVDKALSFYDAIGIGRKGTIDRPQYLRAPFWTVDTLFFMTSKKKNDLKFLYALSQNINWKKYDESTGLPSLAKKTISSILVKVPQDKEQKLIGRVISQIDYVQNLQQRKLEQLKSIKKAMLQKLFVNKDMPILHFKGFNNIWKRSKLGNITKTISSKPYISGAYEEGKYEVVQQGDHPIAGYSNDIPFKNYKDVTLFGDHTLSLFKPRKAFLIASDGIKILSPSVTMDSLFYYYLLEKYKPRSEGYKRHFSILKKSVALFPVTINEQKQIAHVLIIIDKTISLQQERIEKLRNYKQFLLQNMLI